jgi:exodeoxyribonuclease-3
MLNKGLYEIFADLKADIFCVQETKAPDDVMQKIGAELKGYHLFASSAVKPGYSGTAVFSKIKPKSHQIKMGKKEHDQEGRIITLEYDDFYLVNTYVPNSGQELKRLTYRAKWDKDMLNYLKGLDAKKHVVLTGDMNVAHEPIDLARPDSNYNKTAGYTQKEIDGIDNLLSAGLVDTFRHLNGKKVQYTFWSQRFGARAKNIGWRIDYFLVSQRMLGRVKSAFILDKIMGSDHCPIGMEITV